MLVLTRKKMESLQIGDAIVTILSHSGGKVRLAIEAPSHVKIMRTEIIERASASVANGTISKCSEQLDYEENQ